MRYRHAIVPGGTFFFTLVTDRRRPILASDEAVDVLRNAFRSGRQSRPFEIDAIVVMPDAARRKKGEQAIWQHRYWEHQIRDETDFARHVDYIHYNPVKHGLTRSPSAWPYSSFGRYVKAGVYALDWGSDSRIFEGIGHE